MISHAVFPYVATEEASNLHATSHANGASNCYTLHETPTCVRGFPSLSCAETSLAELQGEIINDIDAIGTDAYDTSEGISKAEKVGA